MSDLSTLTWDDVERVFGPECLVAFDADDGLRGREHRLSVLNGQLLAIDEDCDGQMCSQRQTCLCAKWDFARWVGAAEQFRTFLAEQYKRGNFGVAGSLGPWSIATQQPANSYVDFKQREADRFERLNREPREWRREFRGEWNDD